ncbi:MAG: PDZ domain-containing protein, partial [Calditrichota bacterium]
MITVFEDGASERAGLRVGDLIVSINEKYFKNMHDADRILKEARSEKKLAYDIIRGKENLTVEITLATVGLHLPVLIFFFSGLIMMLIGGFVGVSRPQFIAARYLGMAYVVTGFFIAFMEAQRTIKDDFVEVRAIFLIIAIFLSIPLWLHAIHYFPLKHEGLLKRPWVRNVSYALAALAAIWTLFVNDRYVPFFLLLLLVYNALVQFVFRKQASPEYNEINSLIKRFNNIAMIGTFLTIAFLIYTHWGSMDRAANKFGYVGIPLALLPISTIYVIGRYNLLDLDLRVRRNIQYSAFSTVLGLLAVLAVFCMLAYVPRMDLPLPNIQFQGSFIEITEEPMLNKDRQAMEKGVLMLLAITFSYLIFRLRRRGQSFIDRKFFRGSYDYRLASRELSEVMSSELDMKGLAEGMVVKLTELMKVKQAAILFY